MFAGLKHFIAGLAEADEGARAGSEHDLRLAAVALLFHVADLDGTVEPAEAARLRALIRDRFGVDAGEAGRLIAEAKSVDREAVDLFQFTNVLNRLLDHGGRLKVIEMMWEMAYADGKTDELEETTIWRVAELMGVSTRERVSLRQKVAGKNGGELDDEPAAAPFRSPWAREDSA